MKNIIRRFLTFLLFGSPKKTIDNITYLHPNNQLIGKKIVITGGGRGLGFALAKKFKTEGAEVLIAGRDEKQLKKSAEEIGCMYLPIDVQDVISFKSFINQADKLLGGANCLVNNAGVSLHEKGILDVTEEQYDAQFDTNLKGSYFLTQCFIEKCQQNNKQEVRKILFVSSETSITVDERPYGLTKAALNSLVQGLAYRFVKEGYRINAIAPGVTLSDMVGKKDANDLTAGEWRYFLPEEVAEIASFLISDASNCLNGQILICNEGKTLNARWK